MSARLRAGLFRALKMRLVRQVLFLARHASEDAFDVAGAILRAFEDASRTREGCFWHRISLPYRRSLFFTPKPSENASRTTGACFAHGTHIPYHRWPSPVPNANHLATTAHPALRYRMPDTEASCRRSGAGCHVSGEIIKS